MCEKIVLKYNKRLTKHSNENLQSLIQQCSRVIDCKIKENDLITWTLVARLNKKSKLPRTIIVKLKNVRSCDEMNSAVTRYNKLYADDKLNTSVLGIEGVKRPVYIRVPLPSEQITTRLSKEEGEGRRLQICLDPKL